MKNLNRLITRPDGLLTVQSRNRDRDHRPQAIKAAGWPSGFAICAAFVFLLTAAPGARAQGFCPLHVPAVCNQLAGEVADLKAERADLQTQLQHAAPAEKGALASQIKKLNSQIAPKEKLLTTCNSANGKQDQAATFTGTATLTTNNPNAPGPFVVNISIGFVYQAWRHDQIVVASFPAIVFGPYSTPAGNNTTTITLLGANCGAINPKTGRLEVSVTLKFEESNLFAGNSTEVCLSSQVCARRSERRCSSLSLYPTATPT